MKKDRDVRRGRVKIIIPFVVVCLMDPLSMAATGRKPHLAMSVNLRHLMPDLKRDKDVERVNINIAIPFIVACVLDPIMQMLVRSMNLQPQLRGEKCSHLILLADNE